MKKGLILLMSLATLYGYSQNKSDYAKLLERIEILENEAKEAKNTKSNGEETEEKESKIIFGGYGEATMSRHFYSDSWQRYALPSKYADDEGFGRFDVPHAVFMVGYNFGKGWSFGTEIEFEHGGVGTTVEIEEEETGEYESEVEQGGEIVLEQFWINKRWSDAFNLKMGHIVIPVGFTNKYHLPNQYFGVFRPEGDAQIIPNVWHQTGASFWGSKNDWSYEVIFTSGLDADRFSPENWVGGSAGTIYEFKIANNYAGAFRVDNKSVKNLTLGLSGYFGNSAKNTLNTYSYTSTSKGSIFIGSLDWTFTPKDFILRGGAMYGRLKDSYAITIGNANSTNASPSPAKPAVGSSAISIGVEAGYNVFGFSDKLTSNNQKFYVFGRYDYYDSMFTTASGVPDYKYWERECYTAGVNYSPMKQIVIKAEYQMRNMVDPTYNDENTLSLGITWTGFFTKGSM